MSFGADVDTSDARTIVASPISSIGTVQNRGPHSTAPWFCGTGTVSNRSLMPPQPSISAWRRPMCRVQGRRFEPVFTKLTFGKKLADVAFRKRSARAFRISSMVLLGVRFPEWNSLYCGVGDQLLLLLLGQRRAGFGWIERKLGLSGLTSLSAGAILESAELAGGRAVPPLPCGPAAASILVSRASALSNRNPVSQCPGFRLAPIFRG